MKYMAVITALLVFCSSATVAGPKVQVLPDGVVDLGEFEEHEIQKREVYVKNIGDEPLVILRYFSSCSCTHVQYDHAPIAPGDSAVLTVTFNGRHRRPGPVRKVFRLSTNAETPVTGVLVKGEIVRPFQK